MKFAVIRERSRFAQLTAGLGPIRGPWRPRGEGGRHPCHTLGPTSSLSWSRADLRARIRDHLAGWGPVSAWTCPHWADQGAWASGWIDDPL